MMTRRVPCPVCKKFFNGNAEVFTHAKQAHPQAVADYLCTDTSGEEFVERPILHSLDNDEPDSTCSDGECPCWEKRARSRGSLH